jgi:flagellar FliL protein
MSFASRKEQFMSEEEVVAAPEEGKKKSGKKKLIILVVLLLVVGGTAAVVLGGVLKKPKGDAEAAKDAPPAVAATMAPGVFHDLPPILVNLDNSGRQAHFLKLSVSLELATKADEAQIDKVMPRVVDQFQTYLREIRPEDLKGSAGIYRLRQELLSRVVVASQPVQVKDVLFREFLIQ